jgi:drug/metabolite transporter (DMT)-like permease
MKAMLDVPQRSTQKLSWAVRTVLMIVVTASVAICFPVIKAGLVFSPPLKFAGLRTLLAGLALLAVTPLMGQRIWLPKRLLLWVLPLGIIATTLTFGSMFLSPMFTTTAVASVLGNTQPLAVIVLAAIFLSEPFTRWKACAVLLGLTGILLIGVRATGDQGSNSLFGAALALLSSVGAAFGSIMFKKLGPGKNLIALTGWQMVAGSLPLFGLSILMERHRPIQWSMVFAEILLVLALVGSALATIVWVWLLQKYEAGGLSLYLFLTPVFALGTAYATFREPLSLLQSGGVAFILAGIAIELLHPKLETRILT